MQLLILSLDLFHFDIFGIELLFHFVAVLRCRVTIYFKVWSIL